MLAAQGVLKKALVKAMRLPWGGEENSGQTKIFANGAEFLFILFLMVRILLLYFKIRNTIVWVKSGGFFVFFSLQFTSVVPKEFFIFLKITTSTQFVILFVFGLFRP